MIERKKEVIIKLTVDDWWSLSRYAARENKPIRQIAREQLMPLIEDLKKRFPRDPLSQKSDGSDVH